MKTPTITLWATTHCGPYAIYIYKESADKFCDVYDGRSWPDKNQAFTVVLGEHVFNNYTKFNEILIHELTHVLEWIWPARNFSTKTVDGCTALARTIGAGLGEMLTKLEQVPQALPKGARAKRGKVSPRGRRKIQSSQKAHG